MVTADLYIIRCMSDSHDNNEELQSLLNLEAQLHPEEDEEAYARRRFRENLGFAVNSVCQIATTSTNERLRLDAAKYVIERNIGKIDVLGDIGRDDDPLKKFMSSIVSEYSSSIPIEPSHSDRSSNSPIAPVEGNASDAATDS